MRPSTASIVRSLQLLFVTSCLAVVLFYAPLLCIPYFWDEAGYYIPATCDASHGYSLPRELSTGYDWIRKATIRHYFTVVGCPDPN
jgi:hypothetical protein